MNVNARKKSQVKFPRRKVYSLVKTILPKGQKFHLYVVDSNIGNMKIVRVITPAWKSLRPAARIDKVIRMANSGLTANDQKKILRFSVLTPDEYSQIRPRKGARKLVASH